MTILENKSSLGFSFANLREVDVSKYLEKKGNLSYLAWAHAVDQLLQRDPSADWEFGVPVYWGDTVMLYCTVRAFGVTRTCQLPVMDHRNKAIANPDAFQVNTAMMRCLVKTIAMHGIGLSIYYGEDSSPQEESAAPKLVKVLAPKATAEAVKAAQQSLAKCETITALRACFDGLEPVMQDVTRHYASTLKNNLSAAVAA